MNIQFKSAVEIFVENNINLFKNEKDNKAPNFLISSDYDIGDVVVSKSATALIRGLFFWRE
ncbi:hypothetical protein JCM12825_12500 [Desulfurobacterium crinifex]